MKVPLIYTLTILLYIINPIVVPCKAQELNLSNFKKTMLPVKESRELYRLGNTTNQEFVVSLNNGKLHISRLVYSTTITCVLPEGKLIGINRGEFGGILFYKPNDTTRKQIYVNGHMTTANTKEDQFWINLNVMPDNALNKTLQNTFKVKEGNIRQIFTYKDSLYEMEGWSDFLSYGVINKLQVRNDSVTFSTQFKFSNEAPEVLVINKNVIYLSTHDRFYRIRNWHKE
ncbi:MAG: hypothetical protein EOP45_10975, partial [Sphingobacteriaceae bacterium]